MTDLAQTLAEERRQRLRDRRERYALLDEMERLRESALAEVERLTRERDEARKESDRLYTECGQLWDEYKKMCETIRTIGARCVELDDREAVSAILDIVEKVLEEYKP